MSNGASLAPQEIRIDLAVLPETKCQGLIHHFTKYLHLFHLVAEKPFNLVAHGVLARCAEMDFDLVGGFSYLFHKGRAFSFGGGYLNRVVCRVFVGIHVVLLSGA
jgi:hypothetical protein